MFLLVWHKSRAAHHILWTQEGACYLRVLTCEYHAANHMLTTACAAMSAKAMGMPFFSSCMLSTLSPVSGR